MNPYEGQQHAVTPPHHCSATTRPSSVTESTAATIVHECSRPPSRDSRSRHHSVSLSLTIRSSPPQPHLLAVRRSLPQPSSPRNCIFVDHCRIPKGRHFSLFFRIL
ncbi:hypothetical protein AHAS_Ahas18G0232300 [Arachis hypogaea]